MQLQAGIITILMHSRRFKDVSNSIVRFNLSILCLENSEVNMILEEENTEDV